MEGSTLSIGLDEQVREGLRKQIKPKGLGKLERASRDQAITLLDYLGYLDLESDKALLKLKKSHYFAAVAEWRAELQASRLFDISIDESSPEGLSDEEIVLLEAITDLDSADPETGEPAFSLASYSLADIENDAILTRVLNFRLTALSLASKHAGTDASSIANQLERLNDFSGSDDLEDTIASTDDMESLIDHIVAGPIADEGDFAGLVFFRNRSNLESERAFTNAVDDFVDAAQSLNHISINELIETIKDGLNGVSLKERRLFKRLSKNTTAHFYTRLMQLRLFMAGTYVGQLDSDMGPVGLEAIDHYLQLHYDNQEDREKQLKRYVIKINKNFWALNIIGLLRDTSEPEDNTSPKLISVRLGELATKLTNDDEKQAFYGAVQAEVDQLSAAVQRKRRARRGRGLLRRIGRFFIRIGRAIARGIQFIVKAVKQLFKLIKNGIRMLLLEIRDAIVSIRRTLGFVFSRRIVETGPVTSDFDLDFDVITRIDGPLSEEQLEAHQRQLSEIGDAMQGSAKLLQQALPIILKLSQPFGWVVLGIKLVGLVARYLIATVKRYAITGTYLPASS